MGQNHIRIYNDMPEVELVGISDIDKERVEKLAHEYGTKPFTDYKELLNEGLDAVSIVVPTRLHKQVALNAMDTGANILVEKPIADTVENAEIMVEAAKKAQRLLMVGHIERFNPAVIKLKEIIDSGILGKVVSVSTTRVGPYNPRIRDVGIILDLGVHDIDVISYLYDRKVNQVYAVAGSDIHDYEDHATIHLRYNHEFSGVIETNWLTPHKVRSLFAVGLKGVAYLDYLNQTVEVHNEGWIQKAKVEKCEPLQKELSYFVDCILNGREVNPSGDDGKHTLEVAKNAIESYKTEKLIQM